MSTRTLEQKVRRRLPLFLGAACAGMTIQEQQQAIAGTYTMSPEQVRALAIRMSIPLSKAA
jgi:hypothetical protein